MADGGYDKGYSACPCFWGREPSSLVVEAFKMLPDLAGLYVLDVGCGEGKNAHALVEKGARVLAVDCSELALANGRNAFPDDRIEWRFGDAGKMDFGIAEFDMVVAYGLFHCLKNEFEVTTTVKRLQKGEVSG